MKFNCGSVIGLYQQEAKFLINRAGLYCRITKIDGKPMIITRDYRQDRVNLELAGGKVKKASIG